jgi:hypothetical protein
MPSPLLAGRFADKARDAPTALGRHAGYITATVIPCGDDEAVVGYFPDWAGKIVMTIGADEDAKPFGRDCADQGGLDLASNLLQLRNSVLGVEK